MIKRVFYPVDEYTTSGNNWEQQQKDQEIETLIRDGYTSLGTVGLEIHDYTRVKSYIVYTFYRDY